MELRKQSVGGIRWLELSNATVENVTVDEKAVRLYLDLEDRMD
jgi:hypothetical protein